MPAQSKLQLPVRQRRYRFMLTPLADIMFLLLVFFMLSSSLTPYSLLPIRGGGTGERQATASGSEAAPPSGLTADIPIWNVGSGEITVGGQSFPFDALPQLAEALSANETARVVVIARNTAQVQDIASVLEALSAAGIAQVQIAGERVQ